MNVDLFQFLQAHPLIRETESVLNLSELPEESFGDQEVKLGLLRLSKMLSGLGLSSNNSEI